MSRGSRLCAPTLFLLWMEVTTAFFAIPQQPQHTHCQGFRTRHPLLLEATSSTSKLFSESVYELIDDCKIAVVPDFLNAQQVSELRSDAQTLWEAHQFSTDALAGYGSTGKFDPTKNRAVVKLPQWKDPRQGSWSTRQGLGNVLQTVRSDLSRTLNRPQLAQGLATESSRYGWGSTEISYTRFGPGAFLKRHVDEHHEELKGRDGWMHPTRRSISWLIYLNDRDWKGSRYGGQLRCFERSDPHGDARSSTRIGARPNGDLQIGWLRASVEDPVERPVFMDARRHNGQCALYTLKDNNSVQVEYITEEFSAQPLLYMAGGESLTKRYLLAPRYANRFQYIELPKSMFSEYLAGRQQQQQQVVEGQGRPPQVGEILNDVDPRGGTLVLFDSVTLPHEVLATKDRDRWATSGWFHEDQQPPVLSLTT